MNRYLFQQRRSLVGFAHNRNGVRSDIEVSRPYARGDDPAQLGQDFDIVLRTPPI